MDITFRRKGRKYASTGDEADVIEAHNVCSAMWANRTLVVMKVLPQPRHSYRVAMARRVAFWPEAGATSSTTMKRGMRIIEGDNIHQESSLITAKGKALAGTFADLAPTVIESLTAQMSITCRIFHNTTRTTGSEEPTEATTAGSDHKNPKYDE